MDRVYQFKIHGTTYDVKILSRGFETAQVEVNGAVYDVDIITRDTVHKTPKMVRSTFMTETSEPRARSVKPDTPVGGGIVKSPLPGVVLKVNFQESATVKSGDVIMVLEAMKMENEIRAPKTGSLAHLAAEGSSVLEGDTLFEIQ